MAVRPYQIIVWVSVSIRELLEWDARTPRLPAILDPGNNHNFSISRGHLLRWAGIDSKLLDLLGEIRERGQKLPLHAAALWLHSNRPGTREVQPDAAPCRLTLTKGLALYPDATGARLPLVGLRALTQNHLYLTIDGQQRSASLRTPDWGTRVLRWLT